MRKNLSTDDHRRQTVSFISNVKDKGTMLNQQINRIQSNEKITKSTRLIAQRLGSAANLDNLVLDNLSITESIDSQIREQHKREFALFR